MNYNKILTQAAHIMSAFFHPLLIPTIGFILLFNSGFYFSILPWSVVKFILLTVFLSTCVLPAISILILSLNPRFDIRMEKNTDRIMPLILSSAFYYVGYMILQKLPVYPIYKFFLIASILVQITLLFVTIRWKISAHAAAIGGLLGGFLMLSFRLQENPVWILSSLILAAGIVGTARLILGKHTVSQVSAGFLLGFTIMVMTFSYI